MARTRSVISFVAFAALAVPLSLATKGFAQDDHDHAMPGMEHDHSELLVVSDETAPTIRFTMNPDLSGGWYVAIETANFAFAPELADHDHVDGLGHAHIYVDGDKISRVYAPAFYLGPLHEGVRVVDVTLNSNDHRVYAAESGAIATARFVVLAPPMGEAFPPVTETFEAAIMDGALVGADETIRVNVGDGVAIRWTADEAAALHLHGYDIEAEVSPEAALTMLFEANIPGRFPIERHGAAEEATVMYIEVLP